MSATYIIAFPEQGTGKVVTELRNSWLSAMVIWNYLSKKYLGLETVPMFNPKPLWDLWKDPRLEEWEAASLFLTFDRRVLLKKDFPVMKEYLTKLSVALDGPHHFNSIIDELTTLETSDIKGVGFVWTNVAAGVWASPRSEDGDWYDLSLDEDWSLVFDEEYISQRGPLT